MTVQINTTAENDGVRLVEQGSHPASPSSGHELLYVISGSNNPGLYLKDSGGRQIGPFITGSNSSPGGGITFQNEGANLGSASIINFVGNYVTASISGSVANIQVPQSVQDVPSTIQGLQLWLRSDYFSGFSNNQVVTGTWGDYSGLENYASSLGIPTVKTNQINGYPSILLNGSTQYFIAKTPMGNPTFCFLAVFNMNSLANTYTGIIGYDAFTDRGGYMIKDNGKSAEYFGANSYDGTGAATFVTGTWNYVVSNHRASLYDTRRNGVVDKSNTTNYPVPIPNGVVFFGQQAAGSRFLSGNLVELIVYGRNLTSDEIATLETYVQSRYGL